MIALMSVLVLTMVLGLVAIVAAVVVTKRPGEIWPDDGGDYGIRF
jgi:hypothetical protein